MITFFQALVLAVIGLDFFAGLHSFNKWGSESPARQSNRGMDKGHIFLFGIEIDLFEGIGNRAFVCQNETGGDLNSVSTVFIHHFSHLITVGYPAGCNERHFFYNLADFGKQIP